MVSHIYLEIRKKHDFLQEVGLHIHDETKEIIELFETIEVTLQSWRVNYNHLQEYRINTSRPFGQARRSIYPVGNNMGSWCFNHERLILQPRIVLFAPLQFR